MSHAASHRLLIAIISFFLSAQDCDSQHTISYDCRYIGQHDGLANNNVFDISQDKRGFIWLATAGGLQRFDGNRFINYKDVLNDPRELATSGAKLFMEADQDRLWIFKPNKIEGLEILQNKFRLYEDAGSFVNVELKYDTITDAIGKHWLLGRHTFYSLDTASHQTIMNDFFVRASRQRRSSLFMQDDNGNEAWFADYVNGVQFVDKIHKKVFSEKDIFKQQQILRIINAQLRRDQTHARRMMQDSHHNFWITTWEDKFYRYNTRENIITSYSLAILTGNSKTSSESAQPYSVSNIFEDNHQGLWVTTEYAGLLRFNDSLNSFDHIITGNRDQGGSQFNYEIFSIFQDRDDNIWLGTDKGITIFNPYLQNFAVVHHEENNIASLPKNEIQCVLQLANGDILVGTWGGGISIFDSNWKFKKTLHFDGPRELNYIWTLTKNDDGTVWAGCQHGYIHQLDPGRGIVQTIHPGILENSTIRTMIKDAAGNIWMGLNSGKIAEWNRRENRFALYADNLPINNGASPIITQLYIDDKDQCWVGTNAGLRLFDLEKKIFVRNYLPDTNGGGSISARSIEGIGYYDENRIAIASVYGGLNLFNTKTGKFSKHRGIPFNTIHSIEADGKDKFWFTTDYDIFSLNKSTGKYSRIDLAADNINSAFKLTGFYKLRDGSWVTATETELIVFKPGVQYQPGIIPKVEIAGLKVGENNVLIDSLLASAKPASFSYDQNFISIDYSSPNFYLRQPNYYYKLSGVNSDWVDAGKKDFASYTNLEPGDYTFSVKATYGASSSEETKFRIIIHPPFWKTWWFRGIVLLLVIGISTLLVRRRIAAVRETAEMKQRMAETEIMALKAQMNPHFIFNCISAIDNLIQMDQREKATTYLNRFAKMIRAILDSSRNNLVPFEKDLETLKLYLQLEQFRFSDSFKYEIIVADEVIHSDIKVPPMIIQPFVENAIHHGLMNKTSKDRRLWIKIGIENDCLKYTITDNGVGRTFAAATKKANRPEHVSYGMDIAARRIEMHNPGRKERAIEIFDLSDRGEPSGTTIVLWLTLK